MDTNKPRLRQRFGIALVILLCMAGAAAISLFHLMNLSIRLDESQTLWQASHTLSGTIRTVALDVHVPLYHIIVHFWMLVFGDTVETVRMLSLLFFVATIPVIYLIARQVLARRWALLTTVLFSFSPFMTWYATEARMYTMLVFIASLNLYFFMRIAQGRGGWIGFALTSVLGAYTHYFFMFTLAAEALYYLVMRKEFAKGSFKKFVATAALTAVALSPWIYYFVSLGAAGNTRPLLVRPSSVDFSNVYSQFLFGFQTDAVNTILLSCWPLIMLLSLIAVRRQDAKQPFVGLIAAMAVAPIVLAFVVSLVARPFFVSRYMVACVAPLLILLVWLISRYRPVFARGAAVVLIIVTALTSYQQATSASTPIKEDYKAAVSFINENVVPQDLVVISSPFTIYPISYYYTGEAQIQTLPYWDRTQVGSIPAFDSETLPEQVQAYNENHRYIYLVLSQDQGYEDEIYQYYLKNFKQVSRHEFSDGLRVFVYQVGYYTVPALPEATEPAR